MKILYSHKYFADDEVRMILVVQFADGRIQQLDKLVQGTDGVNRHPIGRLGL